MEYDPYDYFEDLEYLSDSYYDDRVPQKPFTDTTATSSTKRKRQMSPSKRRSSYKKRCVETTQQPDPSPPLVQWKPQKIDGPGVYDAPVVKPGSSKSVALLPDWKDRFQHTPGLLQPNNEEGEGDAEGDKHPPTGIDVNDFQSVAGLLTEENMGQLAAVLQAKGLDPEAMQTVLEDLLAGREPDFGSDDEGEDEGPVGEHSPLHENDDEALADTEVVSKMPHRSLKRRSDEDLEATPSSGQAEQTNIIGNTPDEQSTLAPPVSTAEDGVSTKSAAPQSAGTAAADPPITRPRKRSKR